MGQVFTDEAATSNSIFARFGTDYEIRNQWVFEIDLECNDYRLTPFTVEV